MIFVAWKSSRFAYETAEYQTVTKQGNFEVRNYSSMVLASTSMDNADPNNGNTFGRLFKYISKNNKAEQKIAMTTPVFMTKEGQKSEMNFVVPKEVAKAGAPEPKSDQVSVKTWSPGKVAVYRYKGDIRKQSDRDQALATLEKWMAEQKLVASGADSFSAGYDPPFTPKFMRRNEVFIPIQ